MSNGEPEQQLEAPPPVLSAAEHLLNVCTLAAGIAAGEHGGTSAADVMKIYHEIIDAYVADGAFPTS